MIGLATKPNVAALDKLAQCGKKRTMKMSNHGEGKSKAMEQNLAKEAAKAAEQERLAQEEERRKRLHHDKIMETYEKKRAAAQKRLDAHNKREAAKAKKAAEAEKAMRAKDNAHVKIESMANARKHIKFKTKDKKWTPEEVEFVIECKAKHITYPQIMAIVGCTHRQLDYLIKKYHLLELVEQRKAEILEEMTQQFNEEVKPHVVPKA